MSFKSLMPFDPSDGDTLGTLQRQINRMFDDMWHGHRLPAAFGGNGAMALRVDVKDTPAGLEVSAELPGVDEKDISVELNGDMLTIKGEKKLEKDETKDNYHVMERSYGLFQRVVSLPFAPKPDAVQAQFAKGVLKIALVRPPEEAQKTQKITVKAA